MKFVSKYLNCQVPLKPEIKQAINGQVVVQQEGTWALFQNGVYETTDKESIELLRNNPRCGIEFNFIEDTKIDNVKDSKDKKNTDTL